MSHNLWFINVSVPQNLSEKLVVFVKPEIKHSVPSFAQWVGSAIGCTYWFNIADSESLMGLMIKTRYLESGYSIYEDV